MKSFRVIASLTIAATLSVLAACSSGGGGSSPTLPVNNQNPPPPPPPPSMTVSSPPISVSSAIITAAPNGVNGSQSWYSAGTTAWSSNAGSTSSGGNGSNTIDGVGCTQMVEPNGTSELHVHAFVGLYVNGAEEAIPTAIAMENPTQPTTAGSASNNIAVPSASCYYHMHTHDYSGLIHIEDSTIAQSNAIGPASYATLKTFFDLWGEPINANAVASFRGNVAIYIGTPAAGSQIVSSYTPFDGDLSTIKLGHHVAIWIVVGTPPSALPQLKFGIES